MGSQEFESFSELLMQLSPIFTDEDVGNASTPFDHEEGDIHQEQQQPKSRSAKPTDRLKKKKLVPYSTDLQRRRKAELLALRSEVCELSNQLLLLAPTKPALHTVGAPEKLSEGQRQWCREAMVNCEARARAECTNRELKTILAQQTKLFKAIRRLLRHNGKLEDLNLVSLPQPTTDRQLVQFDVREPIFAELSSKLEHLYLQTDTMVPPPSADIAVTIRTQHSLDAHGYFETTVATPLACTAKEAEAMFWEDVTSEEFKKSFFSASDRVLNSKSARSRIKFVSTIFARDHDRIELLRIDSTSIFQRYQENNRMVVVGSTRWLVPSHGVQLEDEFWIVVAPSVVDPVHSSVIQSKYLLRGKFPNCTTFQPMKGASAHEVALNIVGTKLSMYHQLQQNSFLDKVDWHG